MSRNSKKIPWLDPLELAQKISENYKGDWVFLYSGLSEDIKNSKSYIALFPKEKIITDNFLEAETKIKNSDKKWFGYLSYELGNQFEKLPKNKNSPIQLPQIYLINFSLIFEFNHDKESVTANFEDREKLDEVIKYSSKESNRNKVKITKLESNFTDQTYLKTITEIKKMIANGDFYQTNLTRKFFGNLERNIDQTSAFHLFKKLVKISPANYSSFLNLDNNFVVSSSPELFIKVKNDRVLSKPIKGTTPRSGDEKEDRKNKLELKSSLKERAENLMIVDLVRNDLARVCDAGSVKTKKLFDITSYSTIHHMSSDVTGKISKDFNAIDVIKTSFPPGSMTGAPKIKAIEVASQKERLNRGVYSGSIGFLSKDELNLSVVIRTLILQKNKFEFQVGGAITFDSNEEKELEEIYNKARGIIKLLNLEI